MSREILPNTGFIKSKLNKKEISRLNSYIKNKKNKWNHKLAGNISSSYFLEDKDNWFFNNVLLSLIQQYPKEDLRAIIPSVLTKNCSYVLNSFWVNFQKKYEFNPAHSHQGVFSFTIWLKIPTDWKEEQEGDAGFAHPEATDFVFTYTDTMGRIQKFNYKLCPELEGTMVVFPSDFNHMVLPGWTKEGEYRIAVAGDIALASHAPGEQLAG